MRFKSFLLESNSSRKPIDIDSALVFLKDSCGDYLHACSNAQDLLIFRGERHSISPFEIVDTTKFIRGSANTESWYNMWIDNSDKWKKHDFPKRLSSLVCSSIFSDDYGNAKLIFPTDSCRVGVCPQADIWISFNFDDFDNIVSSIDQFQNIIFKTWAFVNDKFHSKDTLPDIKHSLRSYDTKDLSYLKTMARTYYADLKHHLTNCTFERIVQIVMWHYGAEDVVKKTKQLDADSMKEISGFLNSTKAALVITGSSGSYFPRELSRLIKTMNDLKLKNLAQVFDHVLDPEKTGFESLSPAEITAFGGEREIWVGGKCLVIEPGEIKNDEDQVKLIKFFRNYGIKINDVYLEG